MNAIILAAGMGTRLRPLTNEIPKCLVQVNGVPMVERQIRFLHEKGISNVILVSGYRAEKLDYLRDKYNVEIVFNEKFDTCNNIYSLYKVLDRFENSWIIEGDVYLQGNCFRTDLCESTYFAKWHQHYENEWGLETEEGGRLINVHIGEGRGCVMSGISYWIKDDALQVKAMIKDIIDKGNYEELFWDHAVLNLYKKLSLKVCRFDQLSEIDNIEDLRLAERNE